MYRERVRCQSDAVKTSHHFPSEYGGRDAVDDEEVSAGGGSSCCGARCSQTISRGIPGVTGRDEFGVFACERL